MQLLKIMKQLASVKNRPVIIEMKKKGAEQYLKCARASEKIANI